MLAGGSDTARSKVNGDSASSPVVDHYAFPEEDSPG